MIEVSDGFQAAAIGVSRRMLAKAVVEIVDPDITYGESNGSGAAVWSRPEQLHDKILVKDRRYATLEPGRWLLDGSAFLLPEDAATAKGQIGHVGDVLCDENGVFPTEVYAEQPFSNVSILQACSLYFSSDPVDGIPVDFRVCVLSGSATIYEKAFTGNKAVSVTLMDFTVYDPTAIRVYVSRWSVGRRRIRVLDIIPGLYEEWSLSSIVSLDVQMRGNFADLALPYGTADLRIKNTDRRFEPFTRSGIFKSIEERQRIPISMGPVQSDGSVEYAPIGVFFQRSGGWDTGQNDMYIDWQLVDICGLLADRDFVIPETLPTTLAEWFQCFASQLGENFETFWHVDPNYADLPVTVNDPSHLQNRKCGALIRYACMATGTWPRADQETGKLTAEPLWSQGSKITLKQMYDFPVKKSNDFLATLTFKLYDGTENGTIIVISGNATSSSKNLSIDNPFIHTLEAAQTAARQILSQYGGIKIEAVSRGNPASEIGDVDTIWINDSEAKTGRRMEQSFRITGGVLKNNRNVWLQADGSFLFERRVVLTGSGEWTPPAGVTEIRYILGQGAQGSTAGQDGTGPIYYDPDWDEAPSVNAADGQAGKPGRILSGTTMINPGVPISYYCGKGTAAGPHGAIVPEGEDTAFGPNLTTADGKIYFPSFTDIASGNAYGRADVEKPVDGTSDGAKAGAGGTNEIFRLVGYETFTETIPRARFAARSGGMGDNAGGGGNSGGGGVGEGFDPGGGGGTITGSSPVYAKISSRTGGKPGAKGADGFIVIYWDKEAET